MPRNTLEELLISADTPDHTCSISLCTTLPVYGTPLKNQKKIETKTPCRYRVYHQNKNLKCGPGRQEHSFVPPLRRSILLYYRNQQDTVMKLGIMGLPQVGKKTIFSLLTGMSVTPERSQKQGAGEGFAEILDRRFDVLEKMYEPKKSVRARINMELIPDLDSAAIRDGAIFRNIADAEALCHVVRAFEDDAVYHVSGSVDAGRDIESINSELVLHDLLFIEKRLERIAKQKQKDPGLKTEEDLMLRFKDHLESDKPLRTLGVSDDERKLISGYPFLTIKTMIAVLNVAEGDIGTTELQRSCEERFGESGMVFMTISARLESEIAQLETEEEKSEFMTEAGIEEPALNLLTKLCMNALGLISFFTVGKDEVRQWLIPADSLAPEAAGAIHSDIQRGFIRAEVMKYDDLVELGSEEGIKKAGRFHVMGKDYPVEDGDIINFRFNV